MKKRRWRRFLPGSWELVLSAVGTPLLVYLFVSHEPKWLISAATIGPLVYALRHALDQLATPPVDEELVDERSTWTPPARDHTPRPSVFDGDLEAAAVAFFSEVFERLAREAADAYAVGLHIDFEDDDARRPVVTAGFNSQAGVDAALASSPGLFRRRRVPADADEARWDFAFWSHGDHARFGDPDEDPTGAAALERWIRLNGWWYTAEDEDADFGRTLALGDEIQAGLDQVMIVVARELQRDVIPRTLGRSLPVLLHGPVYDSTLAAAAREANPPGLVDDFAAWAEREDLESAEPL